MKMAIQFDSGEVSLIMCMDFKMWQQKKFYFLHVKYNGEEKRLVCSI